MDGENNSRTSAYKKSADNETALAKLNQQLSNLAVQWLPNGDRPKQPIVFVVGLQRAGTTLMMQLLSRYFKCTYPDNIVARFWEAPYAGVIASRSLQLQNVVRSNDDYVSDYGVTRDVFQPHEFGYFWTKWFGFEPTHELSPTQLAQVDLKGLTRQLFLMEHFGRSPLLFKVVPLALNVPFLAQHYSSSYFINVRRDPLFVAQSTYLARMTRYGDESIWWSLKPREYSELRTMPPLEQVSAQIQICGERIEKGLHTIDERRVITVDYGQLCGNPADVLDRLESFLPHLETHFSQPPTPFQNRDLRQLDESLFAQLDRALGTKQRCAG